MQMVQRENEDLAVPRVWVAIELGAVLEGFEGGARGAGGEGESGVELFEVCEGWVAEV